MVHVTRTEKSTKLTTGPRFKTAKGDSRSSEKEARSRSRSRSNLAPAPPHSPGMQSGPSLSCRSRAEVGKLRKGPNFFPRPQSGGKAQRRDASPLGFGFAPVALGAKGSPKGESTRALQQRPGWQAAPNSPH